MIASQSQSQLWCGRQRDVAETFRDKFAWASNCLPLGIVQDFLWWGPLDFLDWYHRRSRPKRRLHAGRGLRASAWALGCSPLLLA